MMLETCVFNAFDKLMIIIVWLLSLMFAWIIGHSTRCKKEHK